MFRFAFTVWIILLLAGMGAPQPGQAAPAAATLEVGTSSTCAYHSLAAALAAANTGDTILVEKGLFVEAPLTLSKDLVLVGGYDSAHPTGCLSPTISGYTTVQRTGTTSSAIVRIASAQVTISNFILEDNGYGSGLEGDSATLWLNNTIVQNNHNHGLLFDNSSWAVLTDVEIANNSADTGGGLYAGGYSYVALDHSWVHDNNGWNAGAGIYAQGGVILTIRNGTRITHNRTVMGCDQGGGIYATGTNTRITLDASEVVSNTALSQGGGLYLGDGIEAIIQNGSWIGENMAYGPALTGGGGGIYVEGLTASLAISDSTFYKNNADPEGGGIWNGAKTLKLENVLFDQNSAAQRGGGLYTTGGSAALQRCYFDGNAAINDSGGAIATYRTTLTVYRSAFVGNTSASLGSAVFVQGAGGPSEPYASLTNCFLTDNLTVVPNRKGPPASGSTLYVEGTSAYLTNNTLAHATQQASFGVHVGSDATVSLKNNILSGFYIGIRRPSGGTGTATSSYDLFYNNAYNYDAGITVSDPVYGDPAFVGGGDYHLTATSAAVDAGASACLSVDYDGDYRPLGAGYDIGADERPLGLFLPLVLNGH